MLEMIFKQFKRELLSPDITPKRAGEISGFITSGYEVGGDNSWILNNSDYVEDIKKYVERFSEMFDSEEFSRLPDGVANRMRIAYRDAVATTSPPRSATCGTCRYVGDCAFC